ALPRVHLLGGLSAEGRDAVASIQKMLDHVRTESPAAAADQHHATLITHALSLRSTLRFAISNAGTKRMIRGFACGGKLSSASRILVSSAVVSVPVSATTSTATSCPVT